MKKMTCVASVEKEELVEFSLPWLAGFFDGEGSVGVYARNTDRSKLFRYYVLVVSLAQSGPRGQKVLQYCQEKYGGTVYQQKSAKTQTINKIMWKWNISADKAVVFLDDILPYTFIKTQQIKLSLDFQKLNSKRSDNITAAKIAELVKDLKQ